MDETYEQFEERVLNKRASHMYHVIKSKLDTKDRLTLSEMAFKNNRKQVGILSNDPLFNIKVFVTLCEIFILIKNNSVFAGCAEVLYTVSPEKVPSIRTQSRIFIC